MCSRSAKAHSAADDWTVIHADHVQRWNELSAQQVVTGAGPYDEASYSAYLLWYRPRTRSTLLSAPVDDTWRPYPEDRARNLHVLVSGTLLHTLHITFLCIILTHGAHFAVAGGA